MTPHRPALSVSERDRDRDLQIAFAVAGMHQASIRHADSKVACLIGVTASIGTAAVDHLVGMDHRIPGWPVLTMLLSVVLMAGLGAAAWRLMCALTPRLAPQAGRNRLAITAAPEPASDIDPRDSRRQCAEAWDLVAVLASIARMKHECVRAALPGLTVAAVACAVLIALDALSRAAA